MDDEVMEILAKVSDDDTDELSDDPEQLKKQLRQEIINHRRLMKLCAKMCEAWNGEWKVDGITRLLRSEEYFEESGAVFNHLSEHHPEWQ